MGQNNVFTVARRTLEGHDLVYQSIKFTNEVWALAELKIPPGNNNTLEVVSRFDFSSPFFQDFFFGLNF